MPASLLLQVDVESTPSVSLVGRNSHPVARVEMDEAFWQACSKLHSDAQKATGERQRLKVQEDFWQSVAVLSTHWIPFDPGAFTPEAEDDGEVVAVGTELARALDTDVAVFPPKGLSATTSLSVLQEDMTRAIQAKLEVTTPKLEKARSMLAQQTEKSAELEAKMDRAQAELAAVRAESERSLATAEPAVSAAEAALDALSGASLDELKFLQTPPAGVEDVMTACLCLLQDR